LFMIGKVLCLIILPNENDYTLPVHVSTRGWR
jgi:hypothetical protein